MDVWKMTKDTSALTDADMASYVKQMEEMVDTMEAANREQAKQIAILEEKVS